MKIKPNASPDELNSPFFTTNEKFCNEFENYIASKNGKVKGDYNAWSFLVFGKITTPRKWKLMYKKSTITSGGNLFLSSKYQSLLVLCEWVTELPVAQGSEFIIRKKSKADFFNKMKNRSLFDLDDSKKYIIESKDKSSPLVAMLTEILKPIFLSGELYSITHKNNKLKIEMRTDKHHFEIMDRLIRVLD